MKRAMFFTFALAALLPTACSDQNAPPPTAEVVGKKIAVDNGAYTNVLNLERGLNACFVGTRFGRGEVGGGSR